jgi:hypothetical protein
MLVRDGPHRHLGSYQNVRVVCERRDRERGQECRPAGPSEGLWQHSPFRHRGIPRNDRKAASTSSNLS